MSKFLLGATLLVVVALSAYSVRTLRIIGGKVNEIRSEERKIGKQIATEAKSRHFDSSLLLAKLNLLNLEIPGMKERDFQFILSLTSHPARFDALAIALPKIKNQLLQPRKILLNIAREDFSFLPQSVQELAATGYIEINECTDLGPGKKLIPALKLYPELPIIVIDDDLTLTPDLTLQLMLEHYLYPDSVIASRVHRVTYAPDGSFEPFSAWDKASDNLLGPSFDLMATTGAGTLFPAGSLHQDALDEVRYTELAFHTDDLWWYFQGRRNGTKVRRLPGYRALEFIPETQEVGLWQTGNKDRNEVNLTKLINEKFFNETGADNGN